ncbi:unnamed protein product [Amoebophrya sp. A120]|nr:unnamed protein product [Amoebophrya sp. A120]|eukprot:GSA120T00017498001.1
MVDAGAAESSCPAHTKKREAVPPFFPMVRKGCEDVSTKLFQCLGRAEAGDRLEGEEVLAKCDFTEYEQCFHQSLAKGPMPMVKVSFDKS